jgi:vitamin B12 transporter
MNSYCINKFIVFMLAAMVVAGLPAGQARAATEEPIADEQALMALFYEEDDLVEAATRSPKPISQVAENVTIVTAEEIEAMNAHTVAEVLRRVAGVFSSPVDFGSSSPVKIQGSDYEHVLILVDGIRWNLVSNDFPQTNAIPVQIIKRIEVIKGPGSSTWGSSLGGVINIITKEPTADSRPAVMVSGSYGEADSQDYRGEVADSIGRFGYYLYGGKQKSDGLVNNRYLESNNFYTKMRLALPRDVGLAFTFGYSDPGQRQFMNLPIMDEDRQLSERIRFATASFDAKLAQELFLNLAIQILENDQKQPSYGMGGWWGVPAGEQLWNWNLDMQRKGATGRLIWEQQRHTVVLGADYGRNTLDEEFYYGPVFGGPMIDVVPTQKEEMWGVYANDTIRINRLTIIPGLRYDYHSIAEDIWSPSLGVTYQLSHATILRGEIGRGFRKPPLFQLTLDPDSLTEKIWSYQAGLETAAAKYFLLKVTLFHHVADNVWSKPQGAWVAQKAKRTGGELEVETISFYDFSLAANTTYVYTDYDNNSGNKDDDEHEVNIFLRYNNPRIARAELFGHLRSWDENTSPSYYNGRFDDMIWDFNISKDVLKTAHTRTAFFFTAHNLFGGSQYFDEIIKNPGRWLEAGIRFHFD